MTEPRRYFLDHAAPKLHERLLSLLDRRIVFFVGLPGTGKSLFVHQLASLAAASREVTLLQWDVARPVFEASETGKAYPQIEGVTQPVIRRAVGLWARAAVAGWGRVQSEKPMLIGEVPLVGYRLMELVSPMDDGAEPLLAAESCRFVLVVPSVEVRRRIVERRENRAASPRNEREREDAPPHLILDAWDEIVALGRQAGITGTEGARGYTASTYQAVYTYLLRRRNLDVLRVETVLPVAQMSVYDFDARCQDLVPTEEETERYIREAERLGPFPERLNLG